MTWGQNSGNASGARTGNGRAPQVDRGRAAGGLGGGGEGGGGARAGRKERAGHARGRRREKRGAREGARGVDEDRVALRAAVARQKPQCVGWLGA